MEKRVTKAIQKALEKKRDDHNKEVSKLSLKWNAKVTLAKLEKVFNRGVGAFHGNPGSVRPSVKSPEQWALARVNSFLYAMKKGKFRSGKHDTDLLPNNHPIKEKMKEEKNERHIKKVVETGDEIHIVYGKSEDWEGIEVTKNDSEEVEEMDMHLEDEEEKMHHEDEEEKDMHDEDEEEKGWHEDDEEKMYHEDEEEKDMHDEDEEDKRSLDNVEKRFFNVQTRVDKKNKRNIVSGHAAVFGQLSEDLGGFREMISPKAFDNVLDNDVRAFFNHDPNFLLARTSSGTLKLAVDKKGLSYSFDVPDTTAGRDLLVSMNRGDITQSSFAFTVEKDSWSNKDGKEIRTIEKVGRLYDVSPVSIPAYPSANDLKVAKRSYKTNTKKGDWQRSTDLLNLKINIIKRK